jgi:hypothetical protein
MSRDCNALRGQYEVSAEPVNPGKHVIEAIHQLIEWAALGIEGLAVAVMQASTGRAAASPA